MFDIQRQGEIVPRKSHVEAAFFVLLKVTLKSTKKYVPIIFYAVFFSHNVVIGVDCVSFSFCGLVKAHLGSNRRTLRSFSPNLNSSAGNPSALATLQANAIKRFVFKRRVVSDHSKVYGSQKLIQQLLHRHQLGH